MVFNFLWEKGAFLYDEEMEKFRVNMDKVVGAVRELKSCLSHSDSHIEDFDEKNGAKCNI